MIGDQVAKCIEGAIPLLEKRLPRIKEIISGSIEAMKTDVYPFEECQAFIKTYDLTPEEVFTLTIYEYLIPEESKILEASFYYQFNTLLREIAAGSAAKADAEALKPFLECFNSLLAKAPAFEGTVYRGIRYDEQLLKRDFFKGNTFTWAGFSSTTKKHINATPFAGNGGIMFIIKAQKKGKYVAPIDLFRKEEQVLYPNGSTFKVLENPRKDETTGLTYVELEEI